jgi:translocation and assembly module TamA
MNWRRFIPGPIAVVMAGVLLLASFRAFALTTADLDPSRHYKLEKNEISGPHAFPRETLLSAMKTTERPWYQIWKPLPEFDPQRFNDDVARLKRFYEAHGFYNARITYKLTLKADRVTPRITVTEGKPVRIAGITVSNASGFAPPQALDRSFELPLKKGDIFDERAYQQGAQVLLDLYTTHAYAHAKVLRHAVLEVEKLRARIEYDILPGVRCVFGDTRISGVAEATRKLVEQQLTFKPGEPFDSRKLATSRSAIVNLELCGCERCREKAVAAFRPSATFGILNAIPYPPPH